MKTGLVLEGGGMRGMYTAGVLDVMIENNICVDLVLGVSAGAAFGCNYKSRQVGRVIRYNKRFCKNWRYSSAASFIFTGDYFGARFCYTSIPCKYDIFDSTTFKQSPEKFYAVCTDVETGKSIYKELSEGNQHDFDWMRASASMPLVSRIVNLDGYKLLDGGMSDSIPLAKSCEMGCDKNIVVLTQVDGYQKKPNKLVSLFKTVYRKYPAVERLMGNRHIMYNNEIALVEQHQKAGIAFVIRPSRFVKVGRTEHNPRVLEEMYQLGRSDTLENLPALSAFCMY